MDYIIFVFGIIPKIQRVDVIDNTLNKNITFENSRGETENFIKSITQTVNSLKSEIFLLVIKNERVCIGSEIEKSQTGYVLKSLKDIPKIFCDFPLIGTEKFHFPVIINSFYFNPQTERDGVWLKGNEDYEVQENQELFQNAVALFKTLLNAISNKPFFDLYHIVETRTPSANEKYFDESWYKESIQKPLRDFLLEIKIVELEDPTSEKKAIKELWFPSKLYTDEVQTKIWQFIYDLFPNLVSQTMRRKI